MDLVCNDNATVPPPVQIQLEVSVGSRIEKCSVGHMVKVNMPAKVVKLVHHVVGAA